MIPYENASRPLRLRHLLAAAGAIASLTSCSAPAPQEASEEGAPGASQEAWSTSPIRVCPVTPSYLVLAPAQEGAEPACPQVPGWGGAWTMRAGSSAVACFPHGENAGDSVLCAYDWSPCWNDAPDLAALQALPNVYLVPIGDGGVAACNEDPMLRSAALFSLADVTCPRTTGGGPNAPKGCDVCGKGVSPGVVRDQLVLPPSTPLHTLAVSLSNGTQQVIIVAPRANARARGASLVDLPLPPAPTGVSYVAGPALGYAYTTPAR